MNDEKIKFNFDEDILFQIDMMIHDEFNDEIAIINEHIGEKYDYYDLIDAKEYKLNYENKLLRIAVIQLQEKIKGSDKE